MSFQISKTEPCEAVGICEALGNVRKGCTEGFIASSNPQICLVSVVLLLDEINQKLTTICSQKG